LNPVKTLRGAGIKPGQTVLAGFPVREALSVCGLDYGQVKEVCRLEKL
jgi:hypothetical protein